MEEKENYFGYLYKTTIHDPEDAFDGCYYFGQKWSSHKVEQYHGSGAKLKAYVARRGSSHLETKVLGWYKDRQSLDRAEQNIIAKFMMTDPKCLNINKGGVHAEMSKETREKLAERKRKEMMGNTLTLGWHPTRETRERMSRAVKRRWDDPKYRKGQTERMSGSTNPMWGKHHTKEAREKISQKVKTANARKGRSLWWNNGKVEILQPQKPGDDFVRGRLSKTWGCRG